jgi:hypothetical protein
MEHQRVVEIGARLLDETIDLDVVAGDKTVDLVGRRVSPL